MKIAHLLILLAIFGTTACAKRAKTTEDTTASTDAVEDTEFVVDSEEAGAPNITQSGPAGEGTSDEIVASDVAPTDQVASSETTTEMKLDESEMQADKEVVISDQIAEYDVENGDTLMWVAFKIYGDYGKWKSIRELNPGVAGKRLTQGMKLKHYVPAEKFVWDPKGSPYLIKVGDTLGTISKEKYGHEKRWKDLYNNNRPMIKKPNLIFAGFTLYYIPERDVASGI